MENEVTSYATVLGRSGNSHEAQHSVSHHCRATGFQRRSSTVEAGPRNIKLEIRIPMEDLALEQTLHRAGSQKAKETLEER